MQYSINPKVCTGCGNCLDACPRGAIFMVDSIARIDEDLCSGCDDCMQACPRDAISREHSVVSQPRPQPVVQPAIPQTPQAPKESGFKKTIITLGSTLVSFAVSRFLSNLDARNNPAQPLRQKNGEKGTGRGSGGERHRRRGRNR